jgi:hypothetical protein
VGIASLVIVYEEYNEVSHVSDDKLSFTTATAHGIPTPTTDLTKAINTTHRIPGTHKEEVMRQTEQMIRDAVIAPSTSLWSSLILVVPKKTDASGVRSKEMENCGRL